MIKNCLDKIIANLEREAETIEKFENMKEVELKCPICGSENIVKNGQYKRNAIYLKDNKIRCARLELQRYKCKTCGKTRTQIPAFLIAKKEYSLSTLFNICKSKIGKYKFSFETGIPASQIKKVRRDFRKIKEDIQKLVAGVNSIDIYDLVKKYKDVIKKRHCK